MRRIDREFLQAVYRGDRGTAKLLVLSGAPIDVETDNKDNALIVACLGGQLKMVKWLVKAGLDVNKPNIDGSTPLLAAIYNIQTPDYSIPRSLRIKQKTGNKICEYLIDHGAQIEVQDCRGLSPIYIATGSKNEPLVRLLSQPKV